MAINITGRPIYHKSFAHTETWYKRYLTILLTPCALGTVVTLTHFWADQTLKDVRKKLHRDKWKDLNSKNVLVAGRYRLMDRDLNVCGHAKDNAKKL